MFENVPCAGIPQNYKCTYVAICNDLYAYSLSVLVLSYTACQCGPKQQICNTINFHMVTMFTNERSESYFYYFCMLRLDTYMGEVFELFRIEHTIAQTL